MQFRLLGPLEVQADGGLVRLGRRRERCLLAVLLLELERVVPVDRLVDLLWDGDPPEHGRRALQVHVARLRGVLGAAGAGDEGGPVRLTTVGSGYLLRADPDSVDVFRFRDLVAKALDAGDAARRADLLRQALALWRGPVLSDLAGARFRESLCVGLEEQRLAAVEERLAADLHVGRHAELVAELTELTRTHPQRQRLTALLMLALYRSGRSVEALDVFRQTRSTMIEHFGIEPGPELQRLHEAVLRTDDAAAAVVLTERPARAVGAGGAGGEAATEARADAPAAVPVPAQLPADVAGFTGREAELAVLDGLLPEPSEPVGGAVVVSAIAGTGGIGKTALAVHWAHRIRDRFPDGQLYVNLRGFDPSGAPMAPAEAVRGFLDALGISPERVPTEPQPQVGLYRSLMAHRRVLVVLDNARGAEQVRPLLPAAPGCLVVITSRTDLTGLSVTDGAHRLVLDVLSAEEAHTLLTRRLGAGRVAAEPHAARAIVTRCAGLPLALAVVAARAATNPRFGLAAAVEELEGTRHSLDAFDAGEPATDLRTVFSWSYRALTPRAARLFRLLGRHPGPDIGNAAAGSLAGLTPAETRALLTELARANLITEQVPGRYTFHDLVRAYAAERADEDETESDRHAAMHRLLDHYLHTAYAAELHLHPGRDLPTPDPAVPGVAPQPPAGLAPALDWFATEYTVLMTAIDLAATTGFPRHAWQLATALMDFQQRTGRAHDMATAQQAALDCAERLADPDALARVHRSYARAATLLGRYEEAHRHYARALELFDALGKTFSRAQCLISYGVVFQGQKRFEEALGTAVESLELHRSIGHRAGEGDAHLAVGWSYAMLGDYLKTLEHCGAVISRFQGHCSPATVGTAHKNVAYAHYHLGDYRQAIAHYRSSVELLRASGLRMMEPEALEQLGDAYRAAGEPVAARGAWQRALEQLTELDHPDADRVRAKLQEPPHPLPSA